MRTRRDRKEVALLRDRARTAFGCALVFGVMLSAANANANTQRRVLVRVAGADALTPFADEVRQLLSDLDVDVEITGIERVRIDDVVAAQPQDLLAATWIRLDPDTGALYLADPLRERILVREVDAGGREVVREQLLQILRASLEALLIGRTVGDPRQRVEASLRSAARDGSVPVLPDIATAPGAAGRDDDAPAVHSPSQEETAETAASARLVARSTWWLAGALTYGGRRLGSGALTHGPRLAVEIGRAFDDWIVSGYARGRYAVPVSVSGEPVGVTLHGGTAEVGGLVRHRFGPWELGIGAGLAVEWLSGEGSTANDAAFRPTDAPLQTLVAISTDGVVGLRVTQHFAVELRAGVETELKGATFAYRESGTERAVFSPDLLRPRASMGIRLHW